MSNKFFPNYPAYRICSRFGPRTLNGVKGHHNGIDLVAMTEDGKSKVDVITAHTGGVVSYCGYDSKAGNHVVIRVSDRTTMSYCHFRDQLPWKSGDKIEAGTVLGMMGSTGNSTGAHLHWGIKQDGQWIDPEPWLDKDYNDEGAADESIHNSETTKATTCTAALPVIRFGMEGEEVRAMQTLLALRDYPCDNGGADGKFGKGTKAALEAFQESRSLKPDAVCGQLTWPALVSG